MASTAPHERLEAWQLCHKLVLEVYLATRTFPKDERFGLTSQARRAAFSAAANIVEGASKRGSAEFRRYLDISIGSLAELGYILRLSRELEFLKSADAERWAETHRRASQVTWRLYAACRHR
ncbi:MAG: four helix bundle protein [Gemmatimonadetes bacterium]|nr:four helix bundle protein [Gemmatimonadota bacterium]